LIAVRATGFTKFLEASKTGTNDDAQSVRTRQREVNCEYRMVLIIEGVAPAADQAV
jgi:hypothetical protein